MKRIVTLTLALALLTTLVPQARAESRVDMTPSFAFFSHTANVIDEAGATAKFAGSLGYGGRISIWLNDSVALEASGHYGRTSLDGQIAGYPGSIDLALFYGSAQIAVGLGPEKRFLLHGGLGLQGTNYDEAIEGGNIMTGVFGISGWMPLSRTAALRTDLDLHVYSMHFELGGASTQDQSQLDPVLAIGIQFTPGGR